MELEEEAATGLHDFRGSAEELGIRMGVHWEVSNWEPGDWLYMSERSVSCEGSGLEKGWYGIRS